MKYGSIVTIRNFKFLNGYIDKEGFNRRCVVLFDTEDQLCVCPIVIQVNSFNKNPKNYYFLPFTNKRGKQLTFAKLNSIVYVDKTDVLEIIGFLDNYSMIRLIEKIKNNYLNYKNKEYYKDTINKIEEKKLVK